MPLNAKSLALLQLLVATQTRKGWGWAQRDPNPKRRRRDTSPHRRLAHRILAAVDQLSQASTSRTSWPRTGNPRTNRSEHSVYHRRTILAVLHAARRVPHTPSLRVGLGVERGWPSSVCEGGSCACL